MSDVHVGRDSVDEARVWIIFGQELTMAALDMGRRSNREFAESSS